MSVKMVCPTCGRVTYSAAAVNLLEQGIACDCGDTPEVAADGDDDEDPRAA